MLQKPPSLGMGCATFITRMHLGRRKIKLSYFQEVVVYVPHLHIPVEDDLSLNLSRRIGHEITARITSLRNNIMLLARDTGRFATSELQQAFQCYLPLLLGLTAQGGFNDVEFKWRIFEDEHMDIHVGNPWFELLSTLHMMAMVTLIEATSCLLHKHHVHPKEKKFPKYIKKDAVGFFLEASGYLEFCIQGILANLPSCNKKNLPRDFQDWSLGAMSFQALGMGTETQLSLAIESQEATLPVKRRLACERLTFFMKVHDCMSMAEAGKFCEKHLLFLKWKCLEAKAAAYYYHGLFLEKGDYSLGRESCYCFLGAGEFLAESKKCYISYCQASPPARRGLSSPLVGGIAHLHESIPKAALIKSSQIHGWSYGGGENKYLEALPELPEFSLSLKPDEYRLPEIDPLWCEDEKLCI